MSFVPPFAVDGELHGALLNLDDYFFGHDVELPLSAEAAVDRQLVVCSSDVDDDNDDSDRDVEEDVSAEEAAMC